MQVKNQQPKAGVRILRAVGIALAACLILFFIWVPKGFDSHRWQSDKCARMWMSINKHVLGKTKAEVLSLLGQPDKGSDAALNDPKELYYFVPEPVDSKAIVIKFSKDGLAEKVIELDSQFE